MSTHLVPPDDNGFPSVVSAVPGPESILKGDSLRFEASGISGWAKGFRPVIMERGRGALLYDLDGNRFLDLTASFGVAALGYSPPEITQAIITQASRLQHTMAGIYPHDLYPTALRMLTSVFGRTPQPQALIVGSGSEAIEVAQKISLRASGKPGLLAFEGAFHGQTIGALSVVGHNVFRDPFLPRLSHDVVFAPYPNRYRPASSDVVDFSLGRVEAALKGRVSGNPPIGAVLVEPIQNPSGYVIPPVGFLRGLRALCDQYGRLLVADEIFTGSGRCGSWLCSDAEGVVPDLICVGKAMTGGLPSAAVIGDHSVMATLVTDGLVPLHGSTFMANPIACASMVAALRKLADDKLIDRSRVLGEKALAILSDGLANCGPVGQVRGRGLALAIEFVTDRVSRAPDANVTMRVASGLLKQGIIALISGLPDLNVLTMAPPFVIGEPQLEWAMSRVVDQVLLAAIG